MKGLKFLITLFVGTTLAPLSSLAQYSEMAARDNFQAQQRALISRIEAQETRLLALEKELYAVRSQLNTQARAEAAAQAQSAPARPAAAPAAISEQLLSRAGVQSYTVRAGDTLNSVARHHSVSVMELMAINDLGAPDSIQIGSELLIPTLGATPAPRPEKPQAQTQVRPAATPPAPMATYTVRSGDTIATIAKRNGVTVADIVAANGLRDPNRIAIGQKLVLTSRPLPAPSKTGAIVATPKVLAKTNIPAPVPVAKPQPKPAPPAPAPEPTADNPFPSGYAYYTVVSGDSVYSIAKLFGTTQAKLEELNGLAAGGVIHPEQQVVVPMSNYKGPFVSN